jgi:glycosyltransferase involved in cell wall biosynthesis
MQRIPRSQFDLLHYPFYYPCLWPQCPSTVAIHDVLVIEHPEWFPRAWATFTRSLLRRGAERADSVVTGSEVVASAIESLARVPRQRIVVIPYGVDPAIFAPPNAARTETVREKFALRRPFLLQVGAFEPRRGVGLAIQAMQVIRAEIGNVELVLVGDARSPVSSLDAAPHFVRRLGRVGDFDLAALYGAASVVIAPSFGEGFDLPVLEAIACGSVVVASDIPAHVEHFAGFVELFESQRAESLADACVRVLTDSGRAATLRERGPQRASKFSWAASARRHVELWKMITGL